MNLVGGKYSFKDLVDLNQLSLMFEKFSEATGYTTDLVSYPNQRLLISTGKRDICTKFHSVNTSSELHCKESNLILTNALKEDDAINIHHCKSGLIDGATPIIIDGVHLANLFSGQVLFEKPDISRFRNQSKQFNYDEKAYLEALEKVPIVNEKAFRSNLEYLSLMATLVAQQGLTNLKNNEISNAALKNEAYLKRLFDTMNCIVFEMDYEGRYISFAPTREELMYKPPQEIIGKTLDEVFPRDEANNILKFVQACLDENASKTIEYPLLINGEKMWFEGRATPKTKNTVLFITRDISSRKLAENSLRLSEEKFRAIFDSVNDAIFIHDANNGDILDVNKTMCNMYGYTKEEALGLRVQDLSSGEFPYNQKGALDLINKSMGGVSQIFEWNAKHKSGRLFWVEVNMKKAHVGQHERLIMVVREISKRKQVEDRLLESEERYKNIIEGLSVGVAIHIENKIVFVNDALKTLLGYRNENEFIGKNVLEFIHSEDQKIVMNAINDAENQKENTDVSDRKKIQQRLIKSNGEYIVVDTSAILINYYGEKALMVMVNDISEWKHAEKIQSILYNISRAVNSLNGLEEFILLIQKELGRIIDTTNFYVAMFDGNSITLPFFKDEKDHFTEIPEGKTLTKYVIETQKSLLANNAIKEKLILEGELQHHGNLSKIWLGVPLKMEGEVIGALVVQSYTDENAFSESDKKMLEFISDQIGIAIYRKKAEELINKSEERFDLAMKASNDGLFDWNLVTNKVYYSARWKSILGYKEDELPNDLSVWESLSQPEEKDASLQKFKEAIEQKIQYYTVEFRMKHKLGHWVNILSRAQLIYDKDGKALRVVGTHRDLTKQKKAEQELIKAKNKSEENESRLNTFINSIPDIVCFKDGEGRWLLANQADLELFCLENVDYHNKTDAELAEYTNEIYREAFLTCMISDHEAWEKKELSQGIEVIPTINSSNKVYDVIKVPIFYPNGKRKGLAVIGRDITELQNTQNNLLIAKDKAEESDRLKSAFLANMSHEIRTPMNGILGFSELLKQPGLSGEEQQEYIKVIERGGQRMLSIINDLIDISKIEAGLININISDVDLNELMDYFYVFFKAETAKKGLSLSITNKPNASIRIIKSDREKIYAILTNLLKNAIKYTFEGAIEFGYETSEDQVKFFVKDSGIGIPKNRIEAIFDRFVQADIEDQDAREGAGLGLSISKAYIEILGGEIWVDSIEGNGAQFYFTLPNKNS